MNLRIQKKCSLFALLMIILLGCGSVKGYAADTKRKAVHIEYAATQSDFSKKTTKLVKAKDETVRFMGSAGFMPSRVIVRSRGSIDYMALAGVTDVILGSNGYAILQFQKEAQALAAVRWLETQKNVLYAELDRKVTVSEYADVQASAAIWGPAYIGLDQYCKQMGAKVVGNVVVAVVDSGIDTSHAVLRSRIVGGYDFVDGDGVPNDQNGHGTHVSGIIVSGSLGQVKLLPVRVCDSRGTALLSSVGNAIRYSAEHGASVINLSVDGIHSKYVDDSVQYAYDSGSMCVVAAGNNSRKISELDCPAHVDTVLTVGSIGKRGDRSGFSNYGAPLDLVAPGESIYSTYLNGRYATMSGTSMSAPLVSACAAMVKLTHPKLSMQQIQSLLKQSCTGSASVTYYGAGCLNMTKLLGMEAVCDHKMTYKKEVPAACLVQGTKAHYECSICSHVYMDPYGLIPVSTDSLAIAALGHDYAAHILLTPASTKADGKEGSVCRRNNCGAVGNTKAIPCISKISLSSNKAAFSGREFCPVVTAVDRTGKLVNAAYMDVAYINNVAVGKGTVKITFKDRYTGSAAKTIRIRPAKISGAELKNNAITYTGESVSPKIVWNGQLLQENVDYTYSQPGAYKVGEYKITVTGTGCFTGKKTFRYQILPVKPVFKGIAVRDGYAVIVWKRNVKRYDGYQIQYAAEKTFHDPVMLHAEKTKNSVTFFTTARNTKYYWRMRAYKTVGGKNIYSKWTKTRSFISN